MSDAIAERIIKEANNERLHTYFTGQGTDFQYFDSRGNFIGDTLKAAEQILFKIRNTFIDGASLEKDLEQPPTGFGFGTIITTVAALMRGGKIMAKYNGSEKFSWKDEGVAGIFGVAREFRKATFKAIAKSLSTAQKNSIVTSLQDLDVETHINKKIDWNTNDFDLVSAIRELAKRMCDKVDDMRRQNKDFDAMFGNLEISKDHLAQFTGAVSEANYIDKAEDYLTHTQSFADAVRDIEKAEKFIRNNLEKIRQWKSFADAVIDELTKATQIDDAIRELAASFNSLYKGEVVKNFRSLQENIQKIKDAYFALMQTAATDMAEKYCLLEKDALSLSEEIENLPAGLNIVAKTEVRQIAQYAEQRKSAVVEIDYDVKDKRTRFTFSEMLSFFQLYNSRNTDLQIIRSGLVKTAPPAPIPGDPPTPPITKTYSSTLPGRKLKIADYKNWLQNELQKISGAGANDEIEIN